MDQPPPRKTNRKPKLSPQQVAEAFDRWQQGESFVQMAPGYGVQAGALFQATRQQRGGPRPYRRRTIVPDHVVMEAFTRWKNGESLHRMAPEHGLSHTLLYKLTLHLREALPATQAPLHLKLTPQQIVEVGERWQAGESLEQMAPEYGVSHTYLYRVTKTLRAEHPRG